MTLAVVCIVVVALAAFFVYRGVSGDATAAPTYTTGTVQKMTLTSSVSGTGNIEYPNTASVSPSGRRQGQGPVCQAGRHGQEGPGALHSGTTRNSTWTSPTLRTPTTRRCSAVDQAKLSLLSAKSSLASTYKSSHTALAAKQAAAAVTSADLAVQAAENAVTSAEIALQDAKDNAAARTVTAPMDGRDHRPLPRERRRTPGVHRRQPAASAPLTITDPADYQATSPSPSPTSARSRWARRPS